MEPIEFISRLHQMKEFSQLLGIYAGRIHENSEVWQVWRPSLIHDILTHHGALKLGAEDQDSGLPDCAT
ncbi:hypothetical protein [Sulfoacidibacillus ferrooxidans]|uniref:hypothetical protein n=1 Tax=Sulfoacidibacillus ferrooxidans TaxID=2005001 RepID=UPI001F504D5F|nr:hypothetical protein [Sulfoacidibacillus ferrooxidans]